MGQKVNPYGFRLGIVTDWKSRWIADGKQYTDFLVEDIKIRDFVKKSLNHAGVSRVEIERAANKVKINVLRAHLASVETESLDSKKDEKDDAAKKDEES